MAKRESVKESADDSTSLNKKVVGEIGKHAPKLREKSFAWLLGLLIVVGGGVYAAPAVIKLFEKHPEAAGGARTQGKSSPATSGAKSPIVQGNGPVIVTDGPVYNGPVYNGHQTPTKATPEETTKRSDPSKSRADNENGPSSNGGSGEPSTRPSPPTDAKTAGKSDTPSEPTSPAPPPEKITAVYATFKTHGNNKEGGTVKVEWFSDGKPVCELNFKEENWKDPSSHSGQESKDIVFPANGIDKCKVTLTDGTEVNIKWIFDAECTLKTSRDRSIEFKKANVVLDTTGKGRPRSSSDYITKSN